MKSDYCNWQSYELCNVFVLVVDTKARRQLICSGSLKMGGIFSIAGASRDAQTAVPVTIVRSCNRVRCGVQLSGFSDRERPYRGDLPKRGWEGLGKIVVHSATKTEQIDVLQREQQRCRTQI